MGYFRIRKKAITMIELMAVVVIMSIMASLAIPDVINYIGGRKEKTLIENLGLIRTAISQFMIDHSENPKTYMFMATFDENNPSQWRDQVFFQDNDSTNDVHISSPTCLQQLVEDRYLLNLPNNPYTGGPDWQVRGFAEPKNLSTSWLDAVNDDYFINKDIFPRVTTNANRESGVTLNVGNLVGIYDVRAGDSENNYHADIDSWDERQDGKWQDFPNEIKRIIVRPNEIDINTNQMIDFVQMISNGSMEVIAYYIDGTQTLIDPYFLGYYLITGSGSFTTDTATYYRYTAPVSPEEAIIGLSYTDTTGVDPITKTTELTVNVTAVLDHITIDPTNFVVLTNSVYSMFNVVVTAHYLDGSTNIVTPNVQWQHLSGPGSLDQSFNLNTDTTTGTATLKCVYEEAGIQKDTLATIDIEAELSYLTCLPNDVEIQTGESVSLISDVNVVAHFNDGSMKDVTALANWADATTSPPAPVLPFGILAGSNYNAPNNQIGTAIMRCDYSENGITKTVDFPITVKRKLVGVSIDPIAYTVKTGQSINLNTLVDVEATYSDGTQLPVTSANWMHSSGVGAVSANTFIADAAIAGTANLICVVSEDGVTITNNFIMTVKKVVENLNLSSVTTTIKTGESFDLSTITSTAVFSDGTSQVVAPTWSLISGIGSIAGSVYNAPAAISGSAVIKGSYTFDGITVTANFTVTIKRVLSSITLSQTSIEMDTSDTFNLAGITVTAHYTDGASQTVTPNSYAVSFGIGSLSGSTFVAPPDKSTENYNSGSNPSEITFSYTEDSMTSTAIVTATIYKILTGIEADDHDFVMLTGDVKNMNDFAVTAHYTDNVDEIVTSLCTYTVKSGSGSIVGSSFNSGMVNESPEVEISYIYRGVTEKDSVIFSIKRYPTTLDVTPISFDCYTSETYELSSLTYVLHYSDGTSVNLAYYDVTWAVSSGLGVISLPDYEAPEDYDEPSGDSSSLTLTAEYSQSVATDDGTMNYLISGSISGTLQPIPEELVITPDPGVALTNQVKDLNTIFSTMLSVSDGNFGAVNPYWAIVSGTGSISGTSTYNAPSSEDNVTLRATYDYVGYDGTIFGVTKEVDINVYKYPTGLTLSTSNHSMGCYDHFDVDTVTCTVSWSAGPDTTTNAEVWSKTGNGSFSDPDYYANFIADGTATLTATYTDPISGTVVSADLDITVTLVAPYQKPTNLTVNWDTQTKIDLSWDSVFLATSYNLYLDGTFEANVTGTSYTFTGLSSGTWYDMDVAGVNVKGEGPSEQKSNKTDN